jgi:DNA-binding phage protein
MGSTMAKDFLEIEDVMDLLRSEIKQAGGQSAWARSTGIDRTRLNKTLNGQKPPTKTIIKALNLRMVFVPQKGR